MVVWVQHHEPNQGSRCACFRGGTYLRCIIALINPASTWSIRRGAYQNGGEISSPHRAHKITQRLRHRSSKACCFAGERSNSGRGKSQAGACMCGHFLSSLHWQVCSFRLPAQVQRWLYPTPGVLVGGPAVIKANRSGGRTPERFCCKSLGRESKPGLAG